MISLILVVVQIIALILEITFFVKARKYLFIDEKKYDRYSILGNLFLAIIYVVMIINICVVC